MALPLEFHENFELGTKGNFDSEDDQGNRLDFPHQRDLGAMMPWRGAFCCRVDLGKNTEDALITKTVDWDSGEVRWGRFRLFVGEDVQTGNDLDSVALLQFYSGAGQREARLVLARIDPLGLVLVAEVDGEVMEEGSAQFKLPIGGWTTIEFRLDVDSAEGTILAALPGVCVASSEPEVFATITAFGLGAIDQSGDWHGTIYFDSIEVDEDRIYVDTGAHNGELSGGSLFFMQSSFVFVGEGEIDHVSLTDGGSGDCRVRIYDTDEPNMLPAGSLRYDMPSSGAGRFDQSSANRVPFKNGAFVELSGTNPQAIVRLGRIASDKERA